METIKIKSDGLGPQLQAELERVLSEVQNVKSQSDYGFIQQLSEIGKYVDAIRDCRPDLKTATLISEANKIAGETFLSAVDVLRCFRILAFEGGPLPFEKKGEGGPNGDI